MGKLRLTATTGPEFPLLVFLPGARACLGQEEGRQPGQGRETWIGSLGNPSLPQLGPQPPGGLVPVHTSPHTCPYLPVRRQLSNVCPHLLVLGESWL